MKDILDYKDSSSISSLVEKYFEGLTSLEEEQQLRDYFSQPGIDPLFEPLRPLFQYFSEEREQLAEKAHNPAWRWVSIAAACLLLFLGLRFAFPEPQNSSSYVAYVDGERLTDIKLVQEKMLMSLEAFSEPHEALSSQLDALDDFTEILTNEKSTIR